MNPQHSAQSQHQVWMGYTDDDTPQPDPSTSGSSIAHYSYYDPQADLYPPYGDSYYEPYQTISLMNTSPATPGQVAPMAPDLNSCLWPPTGISTYSGMSSSSSGSLFPPPEPEYDNVQLAISTAFHPQAHPHLPPCDTVFRSSDAVFFYISSSTILSACPNAFNTYIGGSLNDPKFRLEPIDLDGPSQELNVVFHMLYGSSCAINSPSLETLINAIDRMPSYSITPKEHIVPSSSLHILLLSHVPYHPFELYSLAASHGLDSLAVKTSSHLLSHRLQNVTDEQVRRIGAIYLKRLAMLHFGRVTELKNILLQPPELHAPAEECSIVQQNKLTRAWAIASASLVWDARPDLSTPSILAVLNPLMHQVDCTGCQQALRERIQDVVVRWSSVKTSYFFSLHSKMGSRPAVRRAFSIVTHLAKHIG
ncbi:unnamed protein product [Cyclocybe aegerita]|uniref:Uncharacterized protein n=1 Tax=Cyclocybe aegerita TaxID=1973307 RepID=A0A8S0W0B2_CYCAE|nr:unnamed protein product [Cyclocybe aegerita]